MKDLTKTEQEVRIANDEWRSTFDAMDEAVALLDADGRILRCNKAMAEFVKKPFSRIIGHECKEMCICIGGHREQCPMVRCRTSLKRESEVINHGEQWCEVSVDPIFGAAGQLQGAVHILRDITERKKAEETLRKSQLQLAESQRIAGIGSWERNLSTNQVMWSDELFRIFGLDPEKVQADFKTLLNLIHPDDREGQRLAVTEAIQKKQPYNTEYRIVKTDGRQAVILAQGEVVCDESGRPVFLRGTAQDITERRQAEQALRKSEERYRSVVENAFDMIYVVAPDGRLLYVNPAWLRTMEYTMDELSHKTIFDIIHPACHSKCSEVFNQLLSGSSFERFETQFTARDGRVIEIEGSASVNMVDGRVQSIQCHLHDITERKRLEEELFRSQQDWEYTFNSITDMVTVHDRDFNIILANKAAEKILGLPIHENMKDRKCYSYFHGTDQVPAGCPSCGCLQSGTAASFEIFEPHLNMFIEVRAIPRLDSSGNSIGLIHVVRDITGRKQAEAEHERLQHEKEQLREQLRQSQKMEAVGTLAGGIAHDFNNILNVIMGYSGLLESMPNMTGKAGEFLSEITNAADRAANLTRGLLAFSRKQHLELKPSNLNDIIHRISAMLQRVIGEDIRLNIDLSEDSLIIICDSGQIEQIVVNLATNARDAMPGGGMLTLKTEIVEADKAFCSQRGIGAPGTFAVMSMTDTGTGMDAAIVQRIFEPFFTTKAVGKGTGLGLSIIYGIVTQHKGFVKCDSEPGQGTVFTIYLPLVRNDASADKKKEKREYVAKGKGETILLAEDDNSGRQLIKVLLEHQGYRVIEAVNGIEVIEQVREHSQDIALMLLDVIMPDMDGYDALVMIKQQFPDTKAILMSGYTADILEQRGIKDVSVPLLKKPISPHELLRTVREVLDE